MGNYISSCSFVPPLAKNAGKVTTVIFPAGEVKQFRDIVKAAELMMDHPNFFLTNSRSLHVNRRFSALSADHDLDLGNLYIFFPMRRLNSIVTPADVAALFLAANSPARRISAAPTARVQPAVPRLSLEGVDLLSSSGLSYSRSRKPVLETITEEPAINGAKSIWTHLTFRHRTLILQRK
ncbi:uncharacterized protein LOC107467590 [Arachis duranensis]|uniref:Uncharacterized protein LOC107467590 n=1 Tax=Arachis duranensis TaxID=130453 RepID=A0A6P4BH62_ARADU|nr:uncharacterized protein LOC107467590 [Arachis duranensis]